MKNSSEGLFISKKPTYIRNNICIALCSVYIALFIGFASSSIIGLVNNDLGLLLVSHIVVPYFIGAFFIPIPALILGVCAIKYTKTHYNEYENHKKTNVKNTICIVLLLFTILTAIHCCRLALSG